jgi:hypothetical protein
MPSNLPAGCAQYDYQSQPGRGASEKRTTENDYSLVYCGNCGAICNVGRLVWVKEFEFKGCPKCLAECAAIMAAESGRPPTICCDRSGAGTDSGSGG